MLVPARVLFAMGFRSWRPPRTCTPFARLYAHLRGAAAARPWLTARATYHGMAGTSLYSITAHNWNLFNGIVRRIISDYGTALCVLLWTLVSLAPQDTPAGIPRRLVIPDTFGAALVFGPDFRVAGCSGVRG